MKKSLRVHDILKERILISRESARRLEDAIRAIVADSRPSPDQHMEVSLIADFEGVEGIAPSFMDELLRVIDSLFAGIGEQCVLQLIIAHPPTRLSSKFEAIARSHAMTILQLSDGSWQLTGHHAAPTTLRESESRQ